MAQNHSKRWQKALQVERDQRIRLEETLEQLAKQHNYLERAFKGATVIPPSYSYPALSHKSRAFILTRTSVFVPLMSSNMSTFICSCQSEVSNFLSTEVGAPGKGDASDEDDDNEFFDAMEDPAEFITVPADPKYHR